MPSYEYICRDCENKYAFQCKISELEDYKNKKCSKCGSVEWVTVFTTSAPQFKGLGWYCKEG